MNKEELVQEVAKKANVTQKETAEVITAWIETVEKAVSKGKKVTLVGFGTFEARQRAAIFRGKGQRALTDLYTAFYIIIFIIEDIYVLA